MAALQCPTHQPTRNQFKKADSSVDSVARLARSRVYNPLAVVSCRRFHVNNQNRFSTIFLLATIFYEFNDFVYQFIM